MWFVTTTIFIHFWALYHGKLVQNVSDFNEIISRKNFNLRTNSQLGIPSTTDWIGLETF